MYIYKTKLPAKSIILLLTILLFPAVPLFSAIPDSANWDLHFQQTFVNQYHPAFNAAYSGKNSLSSSEENSLSLTSTLFIGLKRRLWLYHW